MAAVACRVIALFGVALVVDGAVAAPKRSGPRPDARYIQHLCALAGQDCRPEPRDWPLFVQAGMNDIDRRCEAFLEHLSGRKRGGPSMRRPTQLETAVAALSVSPRAFRTTGLVPGGVSHSALQAIVLARQQRLRLELASAKISSKPAAVAALRTYLCACTPGAIEAAMDFRRPRFGPCR